MRNILDDGGASVILPISSAAPRPEPATATREASGSIQAPTSTVSPQQKLPVDSVEFSDFAKDFLDTSVKGKSPIPIIGTRPGLILDPIPLPKPPGKPHPRPRPRHPAPKEPENPDSPNTPNPPDNHRKRRHHPFTVHKPPNGNGIIKGHKVPSEAGGERVPERHPVPAGRDGEGHPMRYHDIEKHGERDREVNGRIISRRPSDGAEGLRKSIKVNDQVRIYFDRKRNELIVFHQSGRDSNLYSGYVVGSKKAWNQLDPGIRKAFHEFFGILGFDRKGRVEFDASLFV